MKFPWLNAPLMFVLLISLAHMPVTLAQETTARVRVVHASPDAPAVDVYIDGQRVDALTNVPFFTASTYLELPAGDHRVQVTPTGAPADQAVIDATVSLTAGNAYTIAATGLLSNIRATVIEDSLDLIQPGEARINVYHFSPDAPAVDVKLGDGTILAEDLSFPNKTDFTFPAGTYDFLVTPAGESDPVVINLPNTTIEAGFVYDIFATNVLSSLTPELASTFVGNEGAPAATATPAGTEAPTATAIPTATAAPAATATTAPAQAGTARVSIVHASPDAPAVDVYVDGQIPAGLNNVPFFTASPYLDLPAGDHRIQVTPAGSPADDAVIDATLTLEANRAYTVAATGLLDDIQATVLEDTLTPTQAGQARVSVYHFSPDAPAVDVKLADGTVLASNLAFPQGVEFTVPAGTYDIIVTPAGADEPVVINLPDTTLQEGNVYNIYAINTLDNITARVTTTNVGTNAPAPATLTPTPPAQVPTSLPTATPVRPATLPVTSQESPLPIGMLTAAAILLIGMGGLALGLRRSMKR